MSVWTSEWVDSGGCPDGVVKRVLTLNGSTAHSLSPVLPSWNGNEKHRASLNLEATGMPRLNPRHFRTVESCAVLKTRCLHHLFPPELALTPVYYDQSLRWSGNPPEPVIVL